MIDVAIVDDLEELDQLAIKVIADMNLSQIPQWNLSYPRKVNFINDVEQQACYVYRENGKILGCLTLLEENDPPYKTIDSWLKEKSMVIHRVLVDPEARRQNIAGKLFEYAETVALQQSFESIKIDTHPENYKMRAFLNKNGYVELEYLEVINRIAYEKVLED